MWSQQQPRRLEHSPSSHAITAVVRLTWTRYVCRPHTLLILLLICSTHGGPGKLLHGVCQEIELARHMNGGHRVSSVHVACVRVPNDNGDLQLHLCRYTRAWTTACS